MVCCLLTSNIVLTIVMLTQMIAFFIYQPKLVAVSNSVAFVNPNAPVYPRLAQGKVWNEVLIFSTLQFYGNMPDMVYYKIIFFYFAYKINLFGKGFVTSCPVIFLLNPFFGTRDCVFFMSRPSFCSCLCVILHMIP